MLLLSLRKESLKLRTDIFLENLYDQICEIYKWSWRVYKNDACLTDAWCGWHQQGKKITVSLVELGVNADKIHKKTCLVPLEAEYFKL